jgi:hypothetical protein
MTHPPEFYEGKLFDARFDAWRSTLTGHRVANGDGTPVRQTRELALDQRNPFVFVSELWGRYVAKSAGRAVNRLKR